MASINEVWAKEPRSSEDFTCVDVDEFDALSITLKPEPFEKYPAKLHARSVAKHLNIKNGLLYIPSRRSANYEDSDQEVFFRQGRYFYYLTGVDMPDCVVTYDIEKDRLALFIPTPNTGRSVIFNGSSPTPKEVQAKYNFDSVSLIATLPAYVNYFAHREKGLIYVLHSYHVSQGAIPQIFTFSDGFRSRLYISPWEYTKLKPAMDAARVIKSPYEIKMIRKANAISSKAHTNVLRHIKYFSNETEVEAIFTATCIGQHAKRQSYSVIAAAGENASTLHYAANNDPLKGRQLLCLDAGCEWDCYAADITRTFPISGKFTPEAKAIYDIVADMQDEAIEMCRPGANYITIHLRTHQIAIRGLMKLGILQNGSEEDLFKSGVSVAFFPHGLGHYMGLEVHDVGDGGNLLYGMQEKSWLANFHHMLQDSSSASTLAPNMVITVEPGIYFSRYALGIYTKDPRYAPYINKPLLEKYYPVGGVRIEDDILITQEGYENLTTAPKGDEALRIINEGVEGEEGKGEEKSGKKGQKKGWFW